MGKKSSGKHYTSKGERRNVSRATTTGMKRARDPSEKLINIQTAYWKGQNPWVTIENPNKSETNKRFIRVKTNTLWGNPKERLKKSYIIGGVSE